MRFQEDNGNLLQQTFSQLITNNIPVLQISQVECFSADKLIKHVRLSLQNMVCQAKFSQIKIETIRAVARQKHALNLSKEVWQNIMKLIMIFIILCYRKEKHQSDPGYKVRLHCFSVDLLTTKIIRPTISHDNENNYIALVNIQPYAYVDAHKNITFLPRRSTVVVKCKYAGPWIHWTVLGHRSKDHNGKKLSKGWQRWKTLAQEPEDIWRAPKSQQKTL